MPMTELNYSFHVPFDWLLRESARAKFALHGIAFVLVFSHSVISTTKKIVRVRILA